MPLCPRLQACIIHAFDATRRTLPPAVAVAARRNRRRLASLTRRKRGHVLNLATAVVDAGEEAWAAVAPALEGDEVALHRLRLLAQPHLPGDAASGRSRGGRAGTLPPPRCQGTTEQRRYLRDLVDFVRAGSGGAVPTELQLRISTSMTSALGRCTYVGASRRVTIAERLFRPGLEDVLWDTVKHELAHAADQAARPTGKSDHGPRWKEWARRLGARPERLCSADEVRRIERVAKKFARRSLDRPLAYPPEVRRWLEERAAGHGSDRTPAARSRVAREGDPDPHQLSIFAPRAASRGPGASSSPTDPVEVPDVE